MGKRYLMRLGKTPFELFDGFETLERNPIGRNNGNLIFGTASHKLFSTSDTVVDANHYRINKKMADTVNDEYDGFILPLANAFRPGFEPELLRTAEFIEGLKIPFLMLSGGAQLPLDGDPSDLKRMEPTVKRFARAVLEKSSALTVRGELTAEYLKSLGFNDVIVVGCPSMTMNGRGHRVEKHAELKPGASIAYNVQTNNPFAGELVQDAENNFAATYMPQDAATLEQMLWGTAPYKTDDARLPLERSHPQFGEAKAEFHLDAPAWIRRMQEMAFSFGPRIHGNIAAILAGTPSVVLAHDGRTLELSKYHAIPTVDLNTQDCPTSVEELYDSVDFTEFNRGHSERFDRLSDFIHENGFSHIYDADQEDALREYEEKLDATAFPAPQKTLLLDQPHESLQRSAKTQERYVDMKKAQKALKTNVQVTEQQFASLVNRLEKTEKSLAETQNALKASSNNTARLRYSVKKLRAIPRAAKRLITRRRRD